MTVTLFISPAANQPGNYLVVVNGEGFSQLVGKKVGARIRGDDAWYDDRLFGIGGLSGDRVQIDGSFSLSHIVPGSTLNEEWGRDEIYALVDVEGLNNPIKSNQVTGFF